MVCFKWLAGVVATVAMLASSEWAFVNAAFPTKFSTKRPTKQPTKSPTRAPTRLPSTNPTRAPTRLPTTNPTRAPTTFESQAPTNPPSLRPSLKPTEKPAERPTDRPTEKPTERPTERPTEKPTEKPTETSLETTQEQEGSDATRAEGPPADNTALLAVSIPGVIIVLAGVAYLFLAARNSAREKITIPPTKTRTDDDDDYNDSGDIVSGPKSVVHVAGHRPKNNALAPVGGAHGQDRAPVLPPSNAADPHVSPLAQRSMQINYAAAINKLYD